MRMQTQQMQQTQTPLLTKKQAARYLNISEGGIERLRRNGLRYVRVGNLVRFKLEELAAYVEANTRGGGVASAAYSIWTQRSGAAATGAAANYQLFHEVGGLSVQNLSCPEPFLLFEPPMVHNPAINSSKSCLSSSNKTRK